MCSWRDRLLGYGLLWLRVLMGLTIAYHGYAKLFGGRMDQFAVGVAKMGFPMADFFAWAAVLSEFFGGILIAIGLGTRAAALFVFITMCVAAFVRHGADPFKAKELALAYGVIAGALLLTGPGPLSLDTFLCRKFFSHK